MIEYRKETIGGTYDLLVLDSESGYSLDRNAEVFRVMFVEFVGCNSIGNYEYETANLELFTDRAAAELAFEIRMHTDPFKASGLDLFVLPVETLGDILGAVLTNR